MSEKQNSIIQLFCCETRKLPPVQGISHYLQPDLFFFFFYATITLLYNTGLFAVIAGYRNLGP